MGLRDHNSKITFANQLRGLAVVCVVVAHYAMVYWRQGELVSSYIHAPVVESTSPRWVAYIAFPTLNYGPFGVAIFFLISGFVIPFSLEKMGRLRFIAARALRIFPTYWLASAVTLCAMWVSSRYWGISYKLDQGALVANLLLMHEHLNLPSIDLVNWTLAIEIKFYIVAALMWPFLRQSSVLSVINFSIAMLAFLNWTPASSGIFNFHGISLSLGNTKAELMFLPFLFIGTLFNFAIKGDIATRTLCGSVCAVFLAFLMMWQNTPLAPEFPLVPADYLYALAVFSVCYAGRARFKESKILDFFANISYPLYLVHALIGYAVIRYLMANGWRFTFAAGSAFLLVVAIAYLLHIAIESPSTSLGRRIRRRQRVSDLKPEQDLILTNDRGRDQ